MNIALFGKLNNLGWGLETLISHAQDRAMVPMRLHDETDFPLLAHDESISHMVFIQGRRIDRTTPAWQNCRAKKILLNAEFLPIPGFEGSPEAQARLQAIEPLEDFDLVLNGCPMSTQWLQDVRGIEARSHPMMGVDPLVHRRIPEIERDIDVGFYGAMSDRRARLMGEIAEPLLQRGLTVYWPNVWGEDLIRFINRCKIILNLHFTDQPNTESRIYEVLGCGTLCLSEPISTPDIFRPREHLMIAEGAKDLVEKAILLLQESVLLLEHVARQGYEHVHSNFSMDRFVKLLIYQCSKLDSVLVGEKNGLG